MKIETTYSIKIVPQNDSWDARKYDKLMNLFESCIEPVLCDKILFGWNAAKVCHIYGWNINNLSAKTIEKNHKLIFHSVEIIRKQLPVRKEVGDLLSQKLFTFNSSAAAKEIAELYDEYLKENSDEKRKKLSVRVFSELKCQFLSKASERKEISELLKQNGLELEEILHVMARDYFASNIH